MLHFLKPIKTTLSIILLFPIISFAQWTQIGSDINGEAPNDQSGYATSLSANGNTVAIGARFNDGAGSTSGHVRIFENNSNIWKQKGNDIDGLEISDTFGFSVSISGDGNVVAIGAPDANSFESGQVRVFEFQGGNWVQIGDDIDGEALSDHSGFSVSLSDDGNRVAIGAPDNGVEPVVGSNFGQVRVYENQSNIWVQLGSDIDGDAPEDNLGYAVSLNKDGSIMATGSKEHNSAAGHVKVFEYQTNTWVQIGNDIEGEAMNDKFGGAVSLNNQGNIIAVGAEDNNTTGEVRVFKNQNGNWLQIGNDIEGEGVGDNFGISVSLNSDGSKLAVGAEFNNDFATNAGHVRIYENQSNFWVQIDSDIDGEVAQDRSGQSVSLSADGSIVAIGAYLNDGNGTSSGHVRLFSNSNVLSTENITIDSNNKFTIYPMPITNQIHIDLEKNTNHIKTQLYNIEGKLLYAQDYNNTNEVLINTSSFSKGIYVLKLQLDNTQKTLKIVKH